MDEVRISFIAMCCHEANRIWYQANKDDSQMHIGAIMNNGTEKMQN